jgi:hypothetical protein
VRRQARFNTRAWVSGVIVVNRYPASRSQLPTRYNGSAMNLETTGSPAPRLKLKYSGQHPGIGNTGGF